MDAYTESLEAPSGREANEAMAPEKESARPLKRDFEASFGSIEAFPVHHRDHPASRVEADTPLPSHESSDRDRAVPASADERPRAGPENLHSSKEGGGREGSPAGSSASSLSDLGSRSTPSLRGGSPMVGTAFAALNGNGDGNRGPVAKKPKLTFAEKEARRIEKEFRDEERKRERERRESEKLVHLEERRKRERERDEEKRRKEAEKEEEKRRKEAEKEVERRRKEEEKAVKEEKRRLKDEEKRRKDEEKQRIEDEKKKKAASQKTLSSFFGTPASAKASKDDLSTSPASAGLTTAAPPTTPATPSKKEISPYEKLFPAFFVQNGVRLAPINRFERDEEGSQALQSTIDAYISGNRSPGRKRDFNAAELFHLPSNHSLKRGRPIIAVREIMAELSGNPPKPIDLTTDSQKSQIKRTRAQLQDIPMKYLKFQEDVRPPYQGTYTHTPMYGISKLARNPMRRDLPNTNYDYDSEAEWIEDEDAEDLNSEGEEDEEGLDDVEDMDGFLDDENDELLISRRAMGGIQGDLEPVSTGLCWEDAKTKSSNVKMMAYRMEFMIDPNLKSIDPFSTEYWEPVAAPVQTGTMDPPRLPLNSMKSTNTLQTSPSPLTSTSNNKVSNHKTVPLSFFASSPSTTSTLPLHQSSGGADAKPKKYLPDSDLPAFKEAIQGSDLSKVGLVEVLKKKFPGRTGGAIKATLDLVAKRVGGKEVEKRWVLV